ncbi:hypothetical protein K443DRAFT_447998 [Laccaria amethystina LaAM-08-1]|uniref:Uncharacterized protein n=1 Tax=Laccaria amethystina LaAM-08-1 TaxID=1095629 RepID=A0A0C9Y5C8_9AGAR|nr:hypothetical protein K443DRAFT_447998 [Laccaria amethystina LaAM-08-1]
MATIALSGRGATTTVSAHHQPPMAHDTHQATGARHQKASCFREGGQSTSSDTDMPPQGSEASGLTISRISNHCMYFTTS